MTSFSRLSSKKEPIEKEVDNEDTGYLCLPCVLNIADIIENM